MKGKIKLSRNGMMIRAISWEAKRRGMSYGELSAVLEPGEDEEILRKFMNWLGLPKKKK